MLLDAITHSLATAFPDIPIYTERVLQGMSLPCFSVTTIEASWDTLIGNRYLTWWHMEIRFFPYEDGSASAYENLHDIALQLYGVLEEICYEEDYYFGQRLNHRIADNVLQFMVTYPFLLKRELLPVPLQQQLDVNVEVKDGERVDPKPDPSRIPH